MLQNATALVPSLLAEQPLPKRLRLEYELPRYGRVDDDDYCYFGELLEPCSQDDSSLSASHSCLHDAHEQTPSSDLCLHSSSGRETLSDGVRNSSNLSHIRTTVIAVENLSSNVHGQSGSSVSSQSIASADKLVSPHYFDDALSCT